MVPPDPRGDDQFDDWPPAPRPYPTRPYPTRPYPTRPYPTRGERAPSPYPTRPYPTRPYPTRGDGEVPDGRLDADEWSADVSDLLCARSAVIGLGARLLVTDRRIAVPHVERPKPGYGVSAMARLAPGAAAAAKTASVRATVDNLLQSEYELAVNIDIPDELARKLAEYPESAWAIKEDLARALALTADTAFLWGGGAGEFDGIGTRIARKPGHLPSGAASNLVRTLLGNLRATGHVFTCPGWILSPKTLNTLANETFGPDLPWDATSVLQMDGADGGRLLGYPFITSTAADKRIYLSADWSEAWIGAQRRIVDVGISREVNSRGETTIRAVANHDLVIRRLDVFVVGTVVERRASHQAPHLRGSSRLR